jgi:pSer/pThr/pTyr-binding forkhead associated (FHA) protein
MVMAIKLSIRSRDLDCPPKEHSLEDLVISVGRSQGCTVELEHEEVSRRHFVIKYEGKAYFIVDEGSRHGTWLNDFRLEPAQSYPLSITQVVKIPGFIIEVTSDNQMPRAEKTTVVARKLMGRIFEDLSMKEEVPYLLAARSGDRFIFSGERSSFVLGRAHHLDFVVEDELINKEHLSFIRDINGVRAILINDAKLVVNEQFIKDSVILHHGDMLKIGATDFRFFEHDDDSYSKTHVENVAFEEEHEPISLPDVSAPIKEEYRPVQKRSIVRNLDQIFFALFCFVVFGVSWLWLKMT